MSDILNWQLDLVTSALGTILLTMTEVKVRRLPLAASANNSRYWILRAE